MTRSKSSFGRFWADRKRRKIFQTGMLYVVVVWALVEAASNALPAFGLPDWPLRAALVITAAEDSRRT